MEMGVEYRITDEKSISEKQIEIYNNYGFDHQLEKLEEECLELALAIKTKDKPFNNSFRNLIEEMADVKNLIEQIELQNPEISRGINSWKEYKVNRELDRIAKVNREEVYGE